MADTIIVYMHSGSPSLIKCWLPLLRFRSLSSPTFLSIGCLTSLWSLRFFSFGRNGHYGFAEDPAPETDDTFCEQDPILSPYVRSIIHNSEHE